MKPLVILGSARADGETRKAIDIAFPRGAMDLVILPQLHIGGYDYGHANTDDDFAALAAKMAAAEGIVFATPVYWYAMSAPLKFFFDRLTDLTDNLKPRGKALTGKAVWMLATGTDAELPDGFTIPFSRTADYFGMRFCGCGYLYTGHESGLRDEDAVKRFGAHVVAGEIAET